MATQNVENTAPGEEGSQRQKTMLDNWVEPKLPAPAPSFKDYPQLSIEGHGVLENMAPLGTMPSSKLKNMANKGKMLATGQTPEETDASSTPILTPKEAATPEPHNARHVSESTAWTEASPRTPRAAEAQAQAPRPAAPAMPAVHKDGLHRNEYITRVVEQAIAVAVDRALAEGRAPTAYAMRVLWDRHKINMRLVNLFYDVLKGKANRDQITEFHSVITWKKKEGAVDGRALEYFRENPVVPHVFNKDFSFNSPASSARHGHGGHGGHGQQAGHAGRAATEAINRASTSSPHKEAGGHVSKKARIEHSQLHQSSNSPAPANIQSKPQQRIHLHHNKGANAKVVGVNGLVHVNEHKSSPRKSRSLDPSAQGGHEGSASNGVMSAVRLSRSNSVTSTSSLSSLDEAIVGSSFPGEEDSGEANANTRAGNATPAGKKASRQGKRPITGRPTTHGQKATSTRNNNSSSFTAVNSPSLQSSSRRSGTLADDQGMRPFLDEPYTLPPAIGSLPPVPNPRSHKKGAAAAARRLAASTPRDEEIARLKREAKQKSDRYSAEPSFVRFRGPELQAQDESEYEAEREGKVAQPRPVLRFRRPRDERASEDFSSPTRLSFAPDLAPGSGNTSRAQTPTNLGRPPRKAKNAGARMKSSPRKNAQGPSAGRAGHRATPPTGERQDINDDFCQACGGNGDLLCCDGCNFSFHLGCLDPPMSPNNLPDEWFCARHADHHRTPAMPTKGLFGPLIDKMGETNSQAYHLPKDIRDNTFEGVRTGPEGEYEDHPTTKKKLEDVPDYYKLKDKAGNPVLCHACGKSSEGKKVIITCGFCPLHWHLDCLDPPLANPPPHSLHNPWKCPCHIEDILSVMPSAMGPAHKFRRLKNTPVIKPALQRGIKNNGRIEVEVDSDYEFSKDEEMNFLEEEIHGQVYQVPEKGLVLDFISQARRKRREAPHADDRSMQSRSVDKQPQIDTSPETSPAFRKHSLEEQRAALNLAELATAAQVPGDQTSQLIAALLDEAPQSVVDLIARGDVVVESAEGEHRDKKRKVSRQELQSLRAMQARLKAMLEAAEAQEVEEDKVEKDKETEKVAAEKEKEDEEMAEAPPVVDSEAAEVIEEKPSATEKESTPVVEKTDLLTPPQPSSPAGSTGSVKRKREEDDV